MTARLPPQSTPSRRDEMSVRYKQPLIIKTSNRWAQFMGNTYTQIHVHAVFTVQNRMSLVRNRWREELYRYITGIVQNRNTSAV